ncbi:metallophosphoesterase [Bacillota bacterium]
MKVAIVSDIHIDEQQDEKVFEEVFAQCINESGADVLLIAGDISEYYMRTLAFIRRLRKKISAELYFCPGNHDLWSKYEPDISVVDVIRYMEGKNGDEGFLQNRGVLLTDKTALVAGCGWYDYSFAYPEKFTEDQLSQKCYMDRWWRDGIYAKHGMADSEVDALWKNQLAQLVESYSDYDIIFMTHMVNHPAFLVGEDHEKYEMFQYFNGFLGSYGLYEVAKSSHIKFAVSGHVHYRKSFTENGIYYMCRCLGYPKEFSAFGGKEDLAGQIKDAMEIIEIS